MNNWWSPSVNHEAVDDRGRLEVLAALRGVENAVALARTGGNEWADQGRAIWAMRQLQALQGAEEELRKVRSRLCAEARDSRISLREVAEAAGTSHATVRKWSSSPVVFQQDAFQSDAERPAWVLDSNALHQIAREAGISDDVVTSLLGEVEGDADGEGD